MAVITYTSAEAIADIQGATYDALKDRFAALAKVIDAVGAERHAVLTEMRRREREVAIKLRMGALSDDDKILYKSVLDSPSFSRA